MRVFLSSAVVFFAAATLPAQQLYAPQFTFYRDVLPILQQHCQSCHRPGEIAPMPFVTYAETRLFATAIASNAAARPSDDRSE